MNTRRKIGGYIWKEEISRGRMALVKARRSLDSMKLSQITSTGIAEVSLALLEIEETYVTLAKIGREHDRNNPASQNTNQAPAR